MLPLKSREENTKAAELLSAEIEAFKASLSTAEEYAENVQREYDTVKEKLAKATRLVKIYKILLIQKSSELESIEQENDSDSQSLEISGNQFSNKSYGNVDSMTLQHLKDSDAPLTSVDIIKLVTHTDNVSPKSVRNALVRLIKDGRVTKTYSKNKQAFEYKYN